MKNEGNEYRWIQFKLEWKLVLVFLDCCTLHIKVTCTLCSICKLYRLWLIMNYVWIYFVPKSFSFNIYFSMNFIRLQRCEKYLLHQYLKAFSLSYRSKPTFKLMLFRLKHCISTTNNISIHIKTEHWTLHIGSIWCCHDFFSFKTTKKGNFILHCWALLRVRD